MKTLLNPNSIERRWKIKKGEAIKTLLDHEFLDFYDQDEHTVKDIRGFEEKLKSVISQLLKKERLEMAERLRRKEKIEKNKTQGRFQVGLLIIGFNLAIKEHNQSIDDYLKEHEK